MQNLTKMFYVVISCRLRLDKGTETGTMATIHCYLRNGHNDVENPENTVLYGSSTSNKVSYFHLFETGTCNTVLI